MKKWLVILAAAVIALTVSARAAQLPEEVRKALPEGAEEILRRVDLEEGHALQHGIRAVWEQMRKEAGEILRQRLRGSEGRAIKPSPSSLLVASLNFIARNRFS